MDHDLRFGVAVQLRARTFNEIMKRSHRLEELGFDSIDIGLQFVIPTDPRAPMFEGWTTAGAIAAKTTRIRIIFGVNPIPYVNPAFCARKALNLDHISNGRFELGLSAGVPGNPDHGMTGIPDWTPRERIARFREYVEVVDRLLRNEVTTYEGRYYKIKEAVMNPRPVQKPRPPIWIAAHGSRMLKHAACYADTWNTGSFLTSFEERLVEVRQKNELVDKYLSEIDRNPDSLRRSLIAYEHKARKNWGLFEMYVSENAFREMINQYVGVGITEFILYWPYREEQLPMFEKIAKNVIPKLKAEYNR
jgi:alkanesulfonate monooxygenase SsuD/methylene tetrahydromethanopterin reductase-like flavin-dependent oxidoreductase (luciferase family)